MYDNKINQEFQKKKKVKRKGESGVNLLGKVSDTLMKAQILH